MLISNNDVAVNVDGVFQFAEILPARRGAPSGAETKQIQLNWILGASSKDLMIKFRRSEKMISIYTKNIPQKKKNETTEEFALRLVFEYSEMYNGLCVKHNELYSKMSNLAAK